MHGLADMSRECMSGVHGRYTAMLSQNRFGRGLKLVCFTVIYSCILKYTLLLGQGRSRSIISRPSNPNDISHACIGAVYIWLSVTISEISIQMEHRARIT